MFTGIIQGLGKVKKIERRLDGARLSINSGRAGRLALSLASLKKGGSIAVNGCCLTAISIDKKKNVFVADLSSETLRITSLGTLKTGSSVNLERPLRLSDELGGHLVQGHVDGVGKILTLNQTPKETGSKNPPTIEMSIRFPKNLRRYLIPKGSVAVDGVSMTLHQLRKTSFTLFIIPHTWQATNFMTKKQGDLVNLEIDIVGKYVENFSRHEKI